MAYNKQPPIRKFCDFVFVTPELHKDFDSFCEMETSPGKSFLPLVALLEYWNRRRPVPSPTIAKYGKLYLHLHSYEIDKLCQWIYDMRETELDPGRDKMELVHTSRFKCLIMLNHLMLLLHNYQMPGKMIDNSWTSSDLGPAVQKRDRSPSPNMQHKKRRLGDSKVS